MKSAPSPPPAPGTDLEDGGLGLGVHIDSWGGFTASQLECWLGGGRILGLQLGEFMALVFGLFGMRVF